MIHEIQLRNLLSFGPDTEPLAMRDLNVLIGTNGSGKSNFIEAISLLRSAPNEIA
ncbi:MAG: AAA family ATPase [Methanothrix sp.]|nr:AAA family ATPase [Methanothrix sp.]